MQYLCTVYRNTSVESAPCAPLDTPSTTLSGCATRRSRLPPMRIGVQIAGEPDYVTTLPSSYSKPSTSVGGSFGWHRRHWMEHQYTVGLLMSWGLATDNDIRLNVYDERTDRMTA